MNEATVPFITLPNWIKAAAWCGFNIDPIFKQHGIEPDLLHLEDARIGVTTLNELMISCVEAANTAGRGQHFPFILGETFTFEYLPEMETYINTSSSLRDAARVLTWVHELISPYVDIRLEEDHRIARMVLVYTPDTGIQPGFELVPYTSESFFTTLVKFARLLLGEQAPIRILRFRHPPPSYAEKYEEYFRIPVAFNQDRDVIEMDREMLDKPLHGAFPDLHRQAEILVQQRLARQPFRLGIAAQVQKLFDGDPALLGQGIDEIAGLLNMHPRSLQRRLRQEGTGYAELQDEARLRCAVKALQAGQETLESLSDRLGFSDRRSFTRAFKRWTGVSPRQYRRGAG